MILPEKRSRRSGRGRAAAYALKAARAAAPGRRGEDAGRAECRWQREQLPDPIRELILDDQRLRNEICWSVFEA
jgi:hypothetical protein